MKLGQYLGYGAGDAANNLTFSMVSAFLLIYYTDVARISAAAAGTLFLVVRVWGGFTDLFAGRASTDRDAVGQVPALPAVRIGAAAVAARGAFFHPRRPEPWRQARRAYVAYALFQLAASFVNIPYGSLAAAMTQVPDDRAKLSTSRTIAASVTILLIAVVVSPRSPAPGTCSAR